MLFVGLFLPADHAVSCAFALGVSAPELKLGSASEEIANPVPRAGSEWWTVLRKKVSDEFSCGNFVQLQVVAFTFVC